MVRVVELIEQTPAWREWRRNGLGGSDAPVLCGVSRYCTIESLWREKRAAAAMAPEDNLKLARGRVLETQARALYEERAGYAAPPLCVENDEHPWLRASLDGWNAERALPVELKAPRRSEHDETLWGRVPARFVPQCIHILLVTGAERMHYVSYRPELRLPRALAVLAFSVDAAVRQRLLRMEETFWRQVRAGQPPPPVSRVPLLGTCTPVIVF